jgi:hypothetical protein
MIRVKVYNNSGICTNGPIDFDTPDLANDWISKCESDNAFGPAGLYTITRADLDSDPTFLESSKSELILSLKFEIDKIIKNMYSVSEMVMLSLSGSQSHKTFLEMKGTLLAAYEEADPIITSINACTNLVEINAIKSAEHTIIGEQIWL